MNGKFFRIETTAAHGQQVDEPPNTGAWEMTVALCAILALLLALIAMVYFVFFR